MVEDPLQNSSVAEKKLPNYCIEESKMSFHTRLHTYSVTTITFQILYESYVQFVKFYPAGYLLVNVSQKCGKVEITI